MPVRNAFKIRAADTTIIEARQFLQLYSPLVLKQLQQDDSFSSKLIIVRGSPGSGKSSLLRLFETDTLIEIYNRRNQFEDDTLIEHLSQLDIIRENGPKVVGIYIQCDSSLRDIYNLNPDRDPLRLFNSLLDTRIIVSFIRGIKLLREKGCINYSNDLIFEPLPPGEAPPPMFSRSRTIEELKELCSQTERDFGTLLNSFPGDPIPSSIQPHARVYSIPFLAFQVKRNHLFPHILPLIMLDDVQELYTEQRDALKAELIRRTSIPRWLSIRSEVYGIEELISLEGAEKGREYHHIDLDKIKDVDFNRFAENVIERRLQHTEALQQVTVRDFKALLPPPPDENISKESVEAILKKMKDRLRNVSIGHSFFEKIKQAYQEKTLTYNDLLKFQTDYILLNRQSKKEQPSLFPEEQLDPPDSKTEEAARLFLCNNLKRSYYCCFKSLIKIASRNIEQLLSITAPIVDRMIYRAEMNRERIIFAKDQETLLRKSADDYFEILEEKHSRGSYIRQLVDNLGLFFNEVTYQPNAPIAPGVNGFGLTPFELKKVLDNNTKDFQLFREILTNAVAGNVFSVRTTKQGSKGQEKVVFYFNRLLCIKFQLPLNYGGWQPISIKILLRMMHEEVPPSEVVKRGVSSESLSFEEEE